MKLGRCTADNAYAVLAPYSKVEREYRDSLTITEDHQALADKIIDFVRSDDFSGEGEYVANLKAIFAGDLLTARNFGFAASAIAAYQRHETRNAEKIAKATAVPSKHVGTVGAKITVEATVISHKTLDSQYGVTHLYSFLTVDGDKISWFASRDQGFTVGDKINLAGTVKAHNEFRGEAQTVLTRCKAI